MTYNDWIYLVFLALCAFTDYKSKAIPVALLGVGTILSLLLLFYNNNLSMLSVTVSLLPGILLLICAFLKASIGIGDGVLLLIIGLFQGFKKTICILMIALVLTMLASAILLLLKKVTFKSTMPFAVFLFCSSVMIYLFD